MNSVILEARSLTKEYKQTLALDHINLQIKKGKIYGFIGHNGAGKTTTLKAVVGILQFDKGEVFIKGESIRKNPLACKQKIAYIPDNPDLYKNRIHFQTMHRKTYGRGRSTGYLHLYKNP